MAETASQDGSLQTKLTGQQLDAMLQGLKSLPASLAIVASISKLANEALAAKPTPKALTDEILRLIRIEPALLGRLLSLANRDAGRQIINPSEAMEQVGLEAVISDMQSNITAGRAGGGATAGLGLDSGDFRRHCLAVALAAERLADKLPLPLESEEAYVCGLLHDLGALALAALLPKSYRRAAKSAEAGGQNLAERQREVIGLDHATAGRRLAEQWKLPRLIQNVIWMHSKPAAAVPSATPGRMFVGLVGLADAIARREGIDAATAEAIGLEAEAIGELADRLPGLVAEAELPDEQTGEPGVGWPAAADAAVELGRANARLRRRHEELSVWARVLEVLGRFFVHLGPGVTVAEALGSLAAAIGEVIGPGPSASEPVLAYAISPEEDTVLFVRHDGSDLPVWRTLPCRPGFEPTAIAAESTSAAEVATLLLGDEAGLSEWANLSGYRHRQLIGLGRWVGGVFHPAGWSGQGSGQIPQELVDPLAGALAIVQERCRATTLSEQLAGASQQLAQRQQLLADAELQEIVGDMAAGAAHELNNPLAVVSGRAQLMAEKARQKEDRQTWQQVAEQAQRASDIITELMALAAPPEPQPARIEPAGLLNEAAETLADSDHAQAGSARVDIEICEGAPAIWADRAQIREVLVELMCNAASAGRPGVRIRLSAEADQAGQAVLLSVADNGPGMDAETLKRAFTPFFSRQQAGRRPGLGLPRARRLIENNSGRIWISSPPADGTTVQIRLPAVKSGESK